MQLDAHELARQLYDYGEYKACEFVLAKHLKLNALDLDAKCLLAQVFTRVGRPELAIQNYHAIIQLAEALGEETGVYKNMLSSLEEGISQTTANGANSSERASQDEQLSENQKRILSQPVVGECMPIKRLATSEKSLVLLLAGQSNLANAGDQLFAADKRVINFNYLDGFFYHAEDPLLGCSSIGGHIATRLGHIFVTEEGYDSVVLIPVAASGSQISDWVPGKSHFEQMRQAIELMNEADLVPSAVLWQQGETDAMQGTSQAKYRDYFNQMVEGLTSLKITAPVLAALSTFGMGGNMNEIRAALKSLIESGDNILPGPDTDRLGLPFRYDGCHFSDEGMWEVARMWVESLRQLN